MTRRTLISIAVLALPLSLVAGPTARAALAQGVSTAAVTPASGPAGSTVNGSGANWTPGDHIQAYWADDNSTLGGEVVVASGGTFTDPNLKIPAGATAGSHQILFSDVEGRYFETASFDVTGTSPSPPPSSCSAPSVSLTPSVGPVGSQFLMKGAGWISGGVVHITLPNGSKGIFYLQQGTPTVSSGGAWQTTVTVGKSPAGSYTFTFAETGCTSQTGTFQVSASPAPPPTCPSNPTVAFSPSSGHLGTTFTITGSGWVPGGKVTGTLPYGSPGLFYGYQTPIVNASGGFSYKETVGTGPGGPTPPGSYTFTYAEKYGGCSPSFRQTFTVTAKRSAGHVPAAPSNLTVTAVNQHEIRLNWRDNSNNETGFQISNRFITENVGPNTTAYNWGGLSPGTHMCFRIRAFNGVGDSAWDPVSPYGRCATTPNRQQSIQLNVPFDTEIGSAGVPGSGSNNCGPASVTMAIQYYGGSTTVAASAIAIRGYNNRKNGITDFKSSATSAWLAKFGLTEKNVATLSEIRTQLAAGHPVIILVNNYAYRYETPPPYSSNDGAWFTKAHIVVITGINSANVIINDPLRSSGNYAIPLATFENAASTAEPTPNNPSGSTWYAASILRG